MNNFLRGGRGMLFGQDYVCSIMQNRERLLLPLGRYRSDVERLIIIFCVLFSLVMALPAFGQEADGLQQVKPLMIGQKVPDEFWTKEHLFYVKGDTIRKSLEEYRGKLFVLDFWATWCPSCIEGFPKAITLTNQYKGLFEVLLVNSKISKDTYLKIHHMRDGTLRSTPLHTIFEDDYLTALFPHLYIPHYIWINPNGVLVAMTLGDFVSDSQVLYIINQYR